MIHSLLFGVLFNGGLINKIVLWYCHHLIFLLFGVNGLREHAGLYRLSILYSIPRSRIVSPYYGGTVHSGLEPITGVFFESFELTTVPRDCPPRSSHTI